MPNNLKRAVIKEELVALTDDFKKAVILNQFIYWSERVRDFDKFIEEENNRKNKDEEIEKRNGWIFKTAEEMSEEVMLNFSPSTIRSHIKELIANGWLDERDNPKYKFDHTKQYRVNINKIREDLDMLGYSLEGYDNKNRENVDEERISDSENRDLESEEQYQRLHTETTKKNKKQIYSDNTKNKIKEIFNHWVNKDNTISHRNLTKPFKKSIHARLQDFTVDEIQSAIDNYNKVLSSDEYYFTYDNWAIDDFLSRGEGKQLEKFLHGIESFRKNGHDDEEEKDDITEGGRYDLN